MPPLGERVLLRIFLLQFSHQRREVAPELALRRRARAVVAGAPPVMELTVERRCLDCIALRVTLGGLPDRGREELVEERDVARCCAPAYTNLTNLSLAT